MSLEHGLLTSLALSFSACQRYVQALQKMEPSSSLSAPYRVSALPWLIRHVFLYYLGNYQVVVFAILRLDASQTIGYTSGLVLAGVFQMTVGWHVGYFILGGATLAISAASWWVLPEEDCATSGQRNPGI